MHRRSKPARRALPRPPRLLPRRRPHPLRHHDRAIEDEPRGRAVLLCRDSRWTTLHPADTCTSLPNGRIAWTGAYAVVGERCSKGSAACTADDRLLRCRDGALAFAADCRGPRGCRSEGGASFCDPSIAAPGDACGTGEGGACTTDGRALLQCRDGVFVEAEAWGLPPSLDGSTG